MPGILVVNAHGSCRQRSDTAPLPGGLSIRTYNKHKGALLSTSVKKVCDQLSKDGSLLEKVPCGPLSLPFHTMYPDFPVNFNDRNGSGKVSGYEMGLYRVDSNWPAGKMLQRVKVPFDGSRTRVSEIVNWAAVRGFTEIVLLTCRSGPAVRLSGFHEPCGWCQDAVAELQVNETYEDVCMVDLPCINCMSDVYPTKLHFSDCEFRIEARCTSAPKNRVALPLNSAKLGCWQDADEESEVELPRGTINLKLETREK
jgi:hypothetical protein